MPMFFRDVIKTARIKKKLSQKDIAEQLGYSTPQFVSNWERGVSVVGKKDIVKLSKILDIEPNTMIDMVVNENKTKYEAKIRKALKNAYK